MDCLILYMTFALYWNYKWIGQKVLFFIRLHVIQFQWLQHTHTHTPTTNPYASDKVVLVGLIEYIIRIVVLWIVSDKKHLLNYRVVFSLCVEFQPVCMHKSYNNNGSISNVHSVLTYFEVNTCLHDNWEEISFRNNDILPEWDFNLPNFRESEILNSCSSRYSF